MKMEMQVSAHHMVETLTAGLYESKAQCLAELIRNSALGCMPDPNRWSPERVGIEIFFDHLPAAKVRCLFVLDHGSGLTQKGLSRYFQTLGPTLAQLKESPNVFNGASQKGIGRFAALALNEKCIEGDIISRAKHGYHLFSRTEMYGQVRHIPVIPERAELERGYEVDNFVAPDADLLGPLKCLRGSFTAIVIPNPVLTTPEAVYEEMKWHLPREQDKMFAIRIGGVAVQPPPLMDEVNLTWGQDARYRVRLGPGGKDGNGVWLCDELTGLRVASCKRLGGSRLPHPLWSPELAGDIFAPDLLRYQNTARSTLSEDFTRKGNPEWERLKAFLWGEVAPAAKILVERDAIVGDAADALNEVAAMCRDLYGVPDVRKRSKKQKGAVEVDPQPGQLPESQVQEDREVEEDDDEEKPEKKRYKRYFRIKIRDDVYKIYRGQPLHQYVYAQVDPDDPKLILANVRGGYASLPKSPAARREHCLMQILMAVGKSKHPGEDYKAMLFANEVRSEFPK